MPSKPKYEYLLQDEDVKRRYENLKTRSIITATVNLGILGLFCALNHISPKEILKVADTKKFRDEFIDFVRNLEKNGKAGSYIVRFKKVLQSWLSYNNMEIK